MLQTMTENSRRESEIREAANVRENELRNENRTQAETIVGMNEIIARVKEDSWAENEKHSNIVTQLKEASWAENKKFAETIAGLKEDFCGAAELRRGEAALNEARISGEAQRWYNEYRNLLEAGSQPIGREIKGINFPVLLDNSEYSPINLKDPSRGPACGKESWMTLTTSSTKSCR